MKWVAAIALGSKHASGVAIALFKVKCNNNNAYLAMFESLLPNAKNLIHFRCSCNRVLTSNQGTKFHNQINEELMTLLKVNHRLSRTYHPQGYINMEEFV